MVYRRTEPRFGSHTRQGLRHVSVWHVASLSQSVTRCLDVLQPPHLHPFKRGEPRSVEPPSRRGGVFSFNFIFLPECLEAAARSPWRSRRTPCTGSWRSLGLGLGRTWSTGSIPARRRTTTRPNRCFQRNARDGRVEKGGGGDRHSTTTTSL